MRYAPTTQELQDIKSMPAAQRLQYFLTRVMEAEEVWSLADRHGWVMRVQDDKTILSLWPYRQCAEACIDESDLYSHATSLDHFVERIIDSLIEQDIQLDILPGRDSQGALLSAVELQAMFKSLMESGEYFLEG